MECKCGCGKNCKEQYVHGHNRKGVVLSIEQRGKISESHKGYKFPEDSKIKMSNTRKDLINKGKLFSMETKLKMSETWKKKFGDNPKLKTKMKELRAKQKFPNQNSLIEIKIQNFLEQLGIEHYPHFFIEEIPHAYRCDIFVPSMKLVIECDGDWWHGNIQKFLKEKFNERILYQMKLDEIRNKELVDDGFKILRLWEHEIKIMKLNDFENKLKKINSSFNQF